MNTKQTVYFISGLGADERAFSLLDLSFCNPVFVSWVKPGKNESIVSYACRLKEAINDPAPLIVGLSFGGMIAVEIGKRFPYKKLILLSSAKTQKEIPFYLKLMRVLPVHKLAGPSILRAGNFFAYRLMGIEKRVDKVLFTRMLRDADDDFLVWALDQIIHWKNMMIPANTLHIHGTKDILLPYRYIKADYAVREGEHLMLMSKAQEISALLKQLIVDG